MHDRPRYFEDLRVGDRVLTAQREVSRESIIEFARTFDPQPMHTDDVGAAEGPFGVLVASGWQTLCVSMRLIVDARPLGSTPLLGMGVDKVRFTRPVRAGDRLHAEAEIVDLRASSTHGDRAYATLRVRTMNERGEEVASQVWRVMVPRFGGGQLRV